MENGGGLLSRHGMNLFAIGFATLFMGVVGVLAVRGLVPAAVPVFYAAASVAVYPVRVWTTKTKSAHGSIH